MKSLNYIRLIVLFSIIFFWLNLESLAFSQTLHFLGDSLTEGFTNMAAVEQNKWFPFSDTVKNNISGWKKKLSLNQENRILNRYHILNHGISGATTEAVIAHQINKILPSLQEKDIVIVLAGTNDLGSLSANDIWSNLREIYTSILSKKSFLITITIPENSVSVLHFSEKLNSINTKIRHFKENFYNVDLVDLEKLIPYPRSVESEELNFWADDFHLSQSGYEKLGKEVVKSLKRLIRHENL